MHPGLRRHRGAPVTVLLALAVAACGAQVPTPAGTGAASPGPLAATSASPVTGSVTVGPGVSPAVPPGEALLAYGRGAEKDSSITYQPDVVFVGGGPASVRSASADGITWAIDRAAPGAAELRPGSVMALTSLATGRVAAIVDQGDTRIVTLAPIDITDPVKDGRLQVDR